MSHLVKPTHMTSSFFSSWTKKVSVSKVTLVLDATSEFLDTEGVHLKFHRTSQVPRGCPVGWLAVGGFGNRGSGFENEFFESRCRSLFVCKIPVGPKRKLIQIKH